MYSEAMDIAGTSHILLSNRSAAHAKAGNWQEALDDAEACISVNEKFDKGKGHNPFFCSSVQRYDQQLLQTARLRPQNWCSNGYEKT
jgi:hypothetical protein